MSTQESITCTKRGTQGWIDAVPINKRSVRMVKCNTCGKKHLVVHRPYKPRREVALP